MPAGRFSVAGHPRPISHADMREMRPCGTCKLDRPAYHFLSDQMGDHKPRKECMLDRLRRPIISRIRVLKEHDMNLETQEVVNELCDLAQDKLGRWIDVVGEFGGEVDNHELDRMFSWLGRNLEKLFAEARAKRPTFGEPSPALDDNISLTLDINGRPEPSTEDISCRRKRLVYPKISCWTCSGASQRPSPACFFVGTCAPLERKCIFCILIKNFQASTNNVLWHTTPKEREALYTQAYQSALHRYQAGVYQNFGMCPPHAVTMRIERWLDDLFEALVNAENKKFTNPALPTSVEWDILFGLPSTVDVTTNFLPATTTSGHQYINAVVNQITAFAKDPVSKDRKTIMELEARKPSASLMAKARSKQMRHLQKFSEMYAEYYALPYRLADSDSGDSTTEDTSSADGSDGSSDAMDCDESEGDQMSEGS